MTFSISGKRITSSEGFSIESLGREGMRYREGERSLYVFTEYLIPKGIGVSTESIERWDPPFDGDEIGSVKKDEILARIRAALASVGETAVFGS